MLKTFTGFATLLSLIFLGLNSALAQDNNTNQLWLDFNPSWNIGERQKIVADVDYRLNWPYSWDRFIVRAGYQYRVYNFLFKKLKTDEDFLAGLGLFYTLREDGENSFEIRPYQGYKVGFNINEHWKMKNYLRIEERIIHQEESNTSTFGMRVRYQIAADYLVRKAIYESARGFYVPLAVEFFFNIFEESPSYDVLRVTPGIGYQFNSDFKMHATVGYHFTQYDREGLNSVVYRLSVYKTLF